MRKSRKKQPKQTFFSRTAFAVLARRGAADTTINQFQGDQNVTSIGFQERWTEVNRSNPVASPVLGLRRIGQYIGSDGSAHGGARDGARQRPRKDMRPIRQTCYRQR